jgi:modulator of drug activity B
MKKVLIINAHQKYEGIAEGRLTNTVISSAKDFFTSKDIEIKETNIDVSYDIKEEVEKFAWADYIFMQYPVYWMTLPWKAKKYVDEVFSEGASTVTYANDGRSRSDKSKKYGSGGLMQDKKYMLSLTYNCPIEEFSSKDGFFDGLSVDEANYAVHKVFQFCGAKQLETYSMHDIFKGDLDIISELKELNSILENNFKD